MCAPYLGVTRLSLSYCISLFYHQYPCRAIHLKQRVFFFMEQSSGRIPPLIHITFTITGMDDFYAPHLVIYIEKAVEVAEEHRYTICPASCKGTTMQNASASNGYIPNRNNVKNTSQYSFKALHYSTCHR